MSCVCTVCHAQHFYRALHFFSFILAQQTVLCAPFLHFKRNSLFTQSKPSYVIFFFLILFFVLCEAHVCAKSLQDCARNLHRILFTCTVDTLFSPGPFSTSLKTSFCFCFLALWLLCPALISYIFRSVLLPCTLLRLQ